MFPLTLFCQFLSPSLWLPLSLTELRETPGLSSCVRDTLRYKALVVAESGRCTKLSAKKGVPSLSLFIRDEGHPACWRNLSQTHSIASIILRLFPYTLSHFLAVISEETRTCIHTRVYEDTCLPLCVLRNLMHTYNLFNI